MTGDIPKQENINLKWSHDHYIHLNKIEIHIHLMQRLRKNGIITTRP
jgi:hypothetical protein